MTTEPPTSRSLRFSLRNLLLWMVIAGLAIAVVLLGSEVRPLREENRRLRDELGEISITDRAKLHAIQTEAGERLVWKWRVWLPGGRRYKLRCKGGTGEIPEQGFPEGGGIFSIEARDDGGEEIWVAYVITKSPETDKWLGRLETKSGSVGGGYQPWVELRSRTSTSSGVGKSTRVVEPGEHLLLTRWRTADVSSSADIPDPADGFMVWIEQP